MPLTREEAESISGALKHADGGCPVCVQNMCGYMTDLNLGWEWKTVKCDPTSNPYGRFLEVDDDGHPVIVVTQQKPKESEKTNG